jgi:hypothetical protein
MIARQKNKTPAQEGNPNHVPKSLNRWVWI